MSSTQTDIQQPVSKSYPRLVADIGGTNARLAPHTAPRVHGHDHVGTHPVLLDAAQADTLVQVGGDAGVFAHVLVGAGLGQLEISGAGERVCAAATRLLDPGGVGLIVQPQEPELHARMAGTGIEARTADVSAGLADSRIKPALRARQDANHAAQYGDVEGGHHR